jgi:hypothetical protein
MSCIPGYLRLPVVGIKRCAIGNTLKFPFLDLVFQVCGSKRAGDNLAISS